MVNKINKKKLNSLNLRCSICYSQQDTALVLDSPTASVVEGGGGGHPQGHIPYSNHHTTNSKRNLSPTLCHHHSVLHDGKSNFYIHFYYVSSFI